MKGFWISKIKATGNNKKPAEIILKKGANIIIGPSDTGKSYLFSVINFVLGRSTNPDIDIPEGRGYDTFSLEIVSFKNDNNYKLERILNKNNIIVTTSLKETFEFNTTSPLVSENNISNFLLELCDLKGSILLKNRTKGDKQLLSFKNLNQFTSIAEDRIITKESPFYFSQNNSNHILEQSMISLILEEMDFSDVKTIVDPQKKEFKISGQLEFIDKQIINFSEKIQIISERQFPKDQIDANILSLNLESKINAAQNLETEISKYYKLTNELIEKKIYQQELIKRFRILERQYNSDLDRLEFITEAEALSSQLPSQLCPICFKPFSESDLNHLSELENFKEGVQAERIKTKNKLEDLIYSITSYEDNIEQINLLFKENDLRLSDLSDKLNNINPEIQDLQNLLSAFLEAEKINIQLEFLNDEVKNLYAQRANLEKLRLEKDSTDILNVCDYDILKKLSNYIEKRLIKWEYNVKPLVVFNSDFKTFDIVISGKGRGSFGKGKRAISYTACLLGFLDFCLSENKNFSNLIIIDSPLTTFKDNDQAEEEHLSIDDKFFENLTETDKNSQIIFFENKSPNKELALNVIEFTGDKEFGRYGFYPNNN